MGCVIEGGLQAPSFFRSKQDMGDSIKASHRRDAMTLLEWIESELDPDEFTRAQIFESKCIDSYQESEQTRLLNRSINTLIALAYIIVDDEDAKTYRLDRDTLTPAVPLEPII